MTKLNEHEKMRETFRQEALEALGDYLAAGHHAVMVEVERWLASWGSDEDIPAPYPA